MTTCLHLSTTPSKTESQQQTTTANKFCVLKTLKSVARVVVGFEIWLNSDKSWYMKMESREMLTQLLSL